MNKNNQLLILFSISVLISTTVKAQVFKGFSAFKELIEYQGQLYLMDEIYDITSNGFDKLKIDKTIKEVDSDEGFMFVLTSYKFNNNSGVVITSFNSTNFTNSKHQFVNVHLTNSEYDKLYNTFIELENNKPGYNEHILVKFNNRLIIDINNSEGGVYFTLWVDNYSRHTFTSSKWERAHKRYKKFIE